MQILLPRRAIIGIGGAGPRRRPSALPVGALAAAFLVVLACEPTPAPARVIYVDHQLGSAASDRYAPATRSRRGGSDVAFRTLAGAARKAVAGTTVLIRGGTYCQQLKPAHSGSPGRYVTFRNYGDEAVTLAGQTLAPAIDISGRSYVKIQGLKVANVKMWLWGVDAHHNVIQNNHFWAAIRPGGGGKTGVFFQKATFNRIVGNVIEDSTSDNLSLILSDRNVVAGNTIRRARHALWAVKGGSFNVIRDNLFHNELQKIGEVCDCHRGDFDHVVGAYDCTKRNLIERNRFACTPPSKRSPYAGIQYAGQDGIIRRNLFYETVGPGLELTLYGKEANYTTGNRVYHNVFHGSGFAGISLSGAAQFAFTDNVIVNNVLAGSRFVPHDTRWAWCTKTLSGKPVQLLAGRLDGFLFRSNSLFSPDGDSAYLITLGSRSPLVRSQLPVKRLDAKYPHLFQRNTTVDPEFVDTTKRMFDLKAGSGLIDGGDFLTRTVGSGSGTYLPVRDVCFFYDGYGIEGEAGDVVQLAGQTHTARVRTIDYEKNVLLLDHALTWKDGQGVALRYVGPRPDIGAREFLPNGNAPPVAAFTALARAGAPLTVDLDATGSSDAAGKVVRYEWRFGDGTTRRTALARTSHTYEKPGTYRAVLTVVDSGTPGLSSGTALDIHVGHPRLAVSKRALDFGPTGAEASMDLTNAGTGTLSWRLVGAPKWLSADRASGSFVRDQRVVFRVDRTAMGRGTYLRKVRIDAGAAGVADVDVWMRVPVLRRTELVRVGDRWRYLKGTSAPPANWNRLQFDDSKWASGPSGFGYSSDVKYGTRLDDMRGNYLAFYIRRTFETPDPTRIAQLVLKVCYDDGFVAYVNGREVARSPSMGRTRAPAPFDGGSMFKHDEEDPAESYVIRLTPAVLSAGKNVLAIEVHNEWIKGSDAGVVPRLIASVVVDSRSAARGDRLLIAGLGGAGLIAAAAAWGLRRAGVRVRVLPAVLSAARWVRGRGRALVDWSLVAAVSAAIIVFSHCPPEVVDAGRHDKKLHFAAYGLLTLLLLRAIGRNGALVRALTAVLRAVDRRVGLVKVCAALALVGLLGAVNELTQPLTGRQRSVRDLLANLAGAILAVLAWLIGRALLGRRGKP